MSTPSTPAVARFNKDPDADLDFLVDWSSWLADTGGDTIVTSTWITPTGITTHTASFTSTTAIVWLSGGTLGINYPLVNRITTVAGRIEDQTVMVFIEQH